MSIFNIYGISIKCIYIKCIYIVSSFADNIVICNEYIIIFFLNATNIIIIFKLWATPTHIHINTQELRTIRLFIHTSQKYDSKCKKLAVNCVQNFYANFYAKYGTIFVHTCILSNSNIESSTKTEINVILSVSITL